MDKGALLELQGETDESPPARAADDGIFVGYRSAVHAGFSVLLRAGVQARALRAQVRRRESAPACGPDARARAARARGRPLSPL